MSFNHGLWESNTDMWATPQGFYDELNKEFHFTLDPCATHQNAKCEKYYTIEDDGLSKDWNGENVFCNPPYGRQIGPWVQKCLTTKGGQEWHYFRQEQTLDGFMIIFTVRLK